MQYPSLILINAISKFKISNFNFKSYLDNIKNVITSKFMRTLTIKLYASNYVIMNVA